MRRFTLLALCAALLAPTTPADASDDAFAWNGSVNVVGGALDNEPHLRDLTITFDSVRTTPDGPELSTGCKAVGSDYGTLLDGVGSAELTGCATGPDLTGTLTWVRTGTAVTFDGDFTCGNEPRVFKQQKCVLRPSKDTLFDISCLLTPVVVDPS